MERLTNGPFTGHRPAGHDECAHAVEHIEDFVGVAVPVGRNAGRNRSSWDGVQ